MVLLFREPLKEAIEKYDIELQQIMQWGTAYPHVAAAFLVVKMDGVDCGYTYENTFLIG